MDRALPPWETFTRALSLVWENRAFALRVGWPFLLLSVVVGAAIDAGAFLPPESPQVGGVPVAAGKIGVRQGLVDIVITFLQLFLWSVIAVFWHRNVLLGERAAPALPFRFDGVLGRYLLKAIELALVSMGFSVFLVAAFVAAALMLPGFAESMKSGDVLALLPVFGPWMLLMMWVLFRLALCLPAAAVEKRGFGLRDSWRATRGNALSILLLQVFMMVLASLFPAALFAAVLLLGAAAGAAPHALTYAVTGLISLFFVLLGLSLLTLAYARLGMDAPPAEARMAG